MQHFLYLMLAYSGVTPSRLQLQLFPGWLYQVNKIRWTHAVTGLLYKVRNNATSPWKKGVNFRQSHQVNFFLQAQVSYAPSMHLNVSLVGT